MIKNLRDLRLKANFSIEELAVKVGVTSRTIYHWEDGRKPHKVFEKKLREVLNIKDKK